MEDREMTLEEFVAAQENVVDMLRKRDEMNAAVHGGDNLRLSPVTLNAMAVLGHLRRTSSNIAKVVPVDHLDFETDGTKPHLFVPYVVGNDGNWMCNVAYCVSDDDEASHRDHEIHLT